MTDPTPEERAAWRRQVDVANEHDMGHVWLWRAGLLLDAADKADRELVASEAAREEAEREKASYHLRYNDTAAQLVHASRRADAEKARAVKAEQERDQIVNAMREGQKHAAWVGFDQRAEWRRHAEDHAAHGDTPAAAMLGEHVIALLDMLDAPCGTCHPCSHWANQTWINEGERLPHVHEWREAKEARSAAEARVAELEAGIKALADQIKAFYDDDSDKFTKGAYRQALYMAQHDLRALLPRADAPKPDATPTEEN